MAGTHLLTPDGSKPIEEFKKGDRLLSRVESDPNGWVESKTVEEVFTRSGMVVWLTISGRRIGTTAEHPIYVVGKGWRPAGQLEYGDVLSSHNATVGVVEAVSADSEMLTVYNLCVEGWHTYFVGVADWDFSVWAHNAPVEYEVFAKDGKIFIREKGAIEPIKDPAGNVIHFDNPKAADEWIARNAPKKITPQDIPSYPKNPAEFEAWFDKQTPEQLAEYWKDPQLKAKIKNELLGPGGEHEYLMRAEAPKWKEWGVTARELRE